MPLKQTFETNVHALVNLKVPLDHNKFSGLDLYAQALDKAENLAKEVMAMKDAATHLHSQLVLKQSELSQLIQSLESKVKPFEEGIANIKKVMEHDKNSAGINACTAFGVAFNQIEGFSKGCRSKALTLKIDVTGG